MDEILKTATEGLGEDPWEAMGKRLAIWLEKDALAEIVWNAIADLYVPLHVARGYSSWTFLAGCSILLQELLKNSQGMKVKIFHLGDLDPSGLDIQRFIHQTIQYFGVTFEFKRLALTYEQVQAYRLLPNPTKKADPRSKRYVAEYGDRCWELDALEPRTLQAVVRGTVEAEVDKSTWDFIERINQEARQKALEALRRRIRDG
jgi:hypothetical protein